MAIHLAFTDTSSPNPSLWLDADTLGLDPTVYAIAPVNPEYLDHDGSWTQVNEFCSVLAVDWLVGGRPASWGAGSYGADQLQAAADRLVGFSSLDDQARFAAGGIGGAQAASVDGVAGQVASGTAPVGTMIWAGSNEHVVAAYVDSDTTFLFYDPNNGNRESVKRTDFGARMTQYGVNVIVMH